MSEDLRRHRSALPTGSSIDSVNLNQRTVSPITPPSSQSPTDVVGTSAHSFALFQAVHDDHLQSWALASGRQNIYEGVHSADSSESASDSDDEDSPSSPPRWNLTHDPDSFVRWVASQWFDPWTELDRRVYAKVKRLRDAVWPQNQRASRVALRIAMRTKLRSELGHEFPYAFDRSGEPYADYRDALGGSPRRRQGPEDAYTSRSALEVSPSVRLLRRTQRQVVTGVLVPQTQRPLLLSNPRTVASGPAQTLPAMTISATTNAATTNAAPLNDTTTNAVTNNASATNAATTTSTSTASATANTATPDTVTLRDGQRPWLGYSTERQLRRVRKEIKETRAKLGRRVAHGQSARAQRVHLKTLEAQRTRLLTVDAAWLQSRPTSSVWQRVGNPAGPSLAQAAGAPVGHIVRPQYTHSMVPAGVLSSAAHVPSRRDSVALAELPASYAAAASTGNNIPPGSKEELEAAGRSSSLSVPAAAESLPSLVQPPSKVESDVAGPSSLRAQTAPIMSRTHVSSGLKRSVSPKVGDEEDEVQFVSAAPVYLSPTESKRKRRKIERSDEPGRSSSHSSCTCRNLHPRLASGQCQMPLYHKFLDMDPLDFARNIFDIAQCDVHDPTLRSFCQALVRKEGWDASIFMV